MLARVITCSDHSSAAWKQMTWCSEIKVFSHCIRFFSLVGVQEACSAFGRHLLFRLYLTTSVSELGTHLPQINPSSIALQAHRFPSVSTQPPVFLRGYWSLMFVTKLCSSAIADLGRHELVGGIIPSVPSVSSSHYCFLQPQMWGFLRRDVTVWKCGLKDTSLPALRAIVHVRMFEHLSVGKATAGIIASLK